MITGMAEQSHAITMSHPPRAAQKVIGPIMRLLLHTPVLGSAREELMVISFKGRKTGRQYAIPVSAYQIDNNLYALIAARWKHNFRDGATAEVLHDGKTTTLRGELIQDRATVADLYRRSCETYGVKTAQRMMGMKFRVQQMPAVEDFSEVIEREHLAAIRFTPAT
jgi:hypothetical protein